MIHFLIFFYHFTNSVHKVIHKNCLLSLDANVLQINQVTSIEYGEEDDPNTMYDFIVLDQVDYEINRQGYTIFIQIKKELITGFKYHFKVKVSRTQGQDDAVFQTVVIPRGIQFIAYHFNFIFYFHFQSNEINQKFQKVHFHFEKLIQLK